ncbi:MAG: hypothetical protein ACK5MN_05550 [Lachnospiraceae bacterium]
MKKIFRTILVSTVLLVGILALVGCKDQRKNLPEYSVGIIYSTEYLEKSKIEYFDDNMKKVAEDFYSYGYMGHNGYRNAVEFDNVLYEAPQGKAIEKDAGVIIGIDMSSGEVTEYELDRINITEFTCDKQYIYTTSNINGVNYVDRLKKEDGSISSIEISDEYIPELVVDNGELYGFAMGVADVDEGTIISLYKFNFEENCVERLYNLTNTCKFRFN